MQTKFVPVSWHELTRRLNNQGWDGPFSGKKHPFMRMDGIFLLIPNPHHGEDVSVDLIKKVLKRAGINRDQWFEAA